MKKRKRGSEEARKRGSKEASTVLLIFCLALWTMGCGEDEVPTGPDVTSQELVDQGWEFFEDVKYDEALETFVTAIETEPILSDAYNGAGWSAGKLTGRLDEAASYFSNSYSMDPNRIDALGGWTFVVYQSGDWDATIEKADMLLVRRSGWRFLHMQSIDYYDVWLITASAHCKLGRWGTGLEIIIQHLNSDFEADTTSQIGHREILEEIERLSKVYG